MQGPRSPVQKLLFSLLWLCTVPAFLVGATPPQRIVSTSPSITEALFALDLGKRVVGVSTYCTYPPVVLKLPKVGTYLRPDPETIARLNPDLVVLQRTSSELVNRLDALQIRHIEVRQDTLEDIYTGFREIGEAAGIQATAQKLIERMQQSFKRVREESTKVPQKRVLLIVGRRPGTLSDLVAVGPGNFLNRLIDIAGGSNVLSGGTLPPYPRISLETVLRENPDVIVDLTGMEESESAREQERLSTEVLWRGQTGLSAVHSHHVYSVSSTAFVVPGPRAVDVAEMLFRYFHPDGARP